jgi:hypothetical protein
VIGYREGITVENFAVFYHTCDQYADLWEPFCHFFSKYWPDYSGKIYLNSEEKDFEYPGLNIVNLKVGTKNFSHRELAGLARVEEKNILLMMDDLFLMGPVNTQAVMEYYEYFVSADLDSLVFRDFASFEVKIPVNVREASVVVPPSTDMLSSQLAFWKKSSFMKLLNPDDGPWEMEWFGSMRANLSHVKLVCTNEAVIPSLPEGGLHRGRWVEKIVQFLDDEAYDKIDLNTRGFYRPAKATLKQRWKFQWRNYSGKSRRQIMRMIWASRKYYWTR